MLELLCYTTKLGPRLKILQFEGNIARHGGVFYFEKYAKIEIELTELNQNIANFGSCIRMKDKSIARIQYSSFSNNKGTYSFSLILLFLQKTIAGKSGRSLCND